MRRNNTIYGSCFFELIEAGSSTSASAIVPEVVRLTAPNSVIDVGCGVGSWLVAAQQAGITDILGIDGCYVPRERVRIPIQCFEPRDLSLPLQLTRRFDLAMCLEVAEHLPESRADSLVSDLVGAADAVLFSAAIPGQFGTGHINEQWPDYWAKKFLRHEYFALDVLREQFWHREDVETHYKQNCVLYLNERAYARLLPEKAAITDGNVRRLVHPTLYTVYMNISHPFSALRFRSRRGISGWVPDSVRRARRRLMP